LKTDIVYEGKQDTGFLEQIATIPEAAGILSCIQCGTCSATCPVAPMLEHTPRRIFAMIRAGMKDQVLTSLTPWVCSSCYECTVKCPAEIKITEIMYALKRLAVEERVSPLNSDADRFCKLFSELVCKYGRIHEVGLMVKYMLYHHPIDLLRQAPVGLHMLKSGRMPIRPHRIDGLEDFKKMVHRALALEDGVSS